MKKAVRIIVLVSIFLSLLFFAYRFPYSGDDWAFAASYGINQLKSFFSDLNGRYLGNIFAIIICRNNIVKTIFISLVIWLILYFGTKIIKKDNTFLIIILYILLLTVNVKTFAQGIIWSSGFCNYATSTLIVILLLYLYLKKPHLKGIKFYYLALGFFGSFFVENITIAIWLFALTINILDFIKNKKINKDYKWLFIGSSLGALGMFLNPSYLKLVDKTDTYRAFMNSNYIVTMFPYYFLNYVSLVFKLIVVILVIIKNKKGVVNLFYGLSYVACSIGMIFYKSFAADWFTYVMVVFYFLIAIAFWFINRNLLQKEQKSILFLTLLILLPLFFVYPVGARNFLGIYMLLNIFYLSIFIKFINEYYFFVPALILLVVFYSNTFVKFNNDFKKIASLKQQIVEKVKKGDKEIVLNAKYFFNIKVHYPFPDYGFIKSGFSELYHLPDDWQMIFRAGIKKDIE